ncbi:MAG: TetR family transcriptional regulator [Naasia sp.]|nr:TetR family transcriptional regulator [Naasia sp.]
MARAGLAADVVVREAARVIDERGVNGLSLAVLADNLGVRIPSLYKHVDGMPALRRGVMLAAKKDLAEELASAAVGRSRDEAIGAIAHAYRQWALEHPGQYPMTMHAPAPGDDDDTAVSSALLEVIFRVLAGYGLEGDDAIDATRFLRASLHGFVALETGGGFAMPVDLDRSYQRLVTSIVTALNTWAE